MGSPLIGDQSMQVEIDSDMPASVEVNEETGNFQLDAVATVNEASRAGLRAVGAETLEGTVAANAHLALPNLDLPVVVDLTIEQTPIPAETGAFDVNATGQTTAFSFTEENVGTGTITVNDLVLTITPRNANGDPTGLGTFDVECGVGDGQDQTLHTFEQVGQTNGSLTDAVLTSSSEMNVKLPSILAYGLLPLGGGEECQSVTPATIELASPEGETFDPLAGGRLEGTYTLLRVAQRHHQPVRGRPPPARCWWPAMIDAVRAAQRLPDSGLSGDAPVVFRGCSQGGGAAMWAGEYQPSYAPDLNLVGVAGGGVPSNLAQVGLPLDGFGFFLYALPERLTRISENVLGGSPIEVPVLQYHESRDGLVDFGQAQTLRNDYCGLGVDVDWQPVDTNGETGLIRHINMVYWGNEAVNAFVEARLAGQAPVNNCA